MRRFVARGGRVVYGTDLGNQGPPPAVDVEELRLLVEAGLRPGQALAAATSLAAAHLGLAGAGRVAPGARADLLLVDGDPLADLRRPVAGAAGHPRRLGRGEFPTPGSAPRVAGLVTICHPIASFRLTQPLGQNQIAHFPGCLGKDLAIRCCESLIAVVISSRNQRGGGTRMR